MSPFYKNMWTPIAEESFRASDQLQEEVVTTWITNLNQISILA